MVLPGYNAAVRHVAGVISWRGRNEWSLSPQASYWETLMNLCPYSFAHNTWFSINDSQIYWSWTYFQKDWWTAVQCFRAWNPVQLISSALNLLQASYLINTQISIFPLNSKTFHLNTTYEEVENFNQIRKKKKSTMSQQLQLLIHTKLVMVFVLVQSDLFPPKWNSYLSVDYLFFSNKNFITSLILFPKDNLKPLWFVSMLPTCPAVAIIWKPHSFAHFLNNPQGFQEQWPRARCWASSVDTKSSRIGWCNLLSYHPWSRVSSRNVNTDYLNTEYWILNTPSSQSMVWVKSDKYVSECSRWRRIARYTSNKWKADTLWYLNFRRRMTIFFSIWMS